jgi:two-component system sensor histidine kinase KdpD
MTDLRLSTRGAVGQIVGTVGLLAATTALVALLERVVGVADASATYLLAVLAAAYYLGTWAAVASAVGSFLLYNFLFVDPLFTFVVEDPAQVLNLILLLVLGLVVGPLAAGQRRRAEVAIDREREATALYRISRTLAATSTRAAGFAEFADALRAELSLDRVVITAIGDEGRQRVLADSGAEGPMPQTADDHAILHRGDDETAFQWVLVHPAAAASGDPVAAYFLIPIEDGGRVLGAIWAVRPRRKPFGSASETRLVAALADQLGQALERNRLAEEARSAEVARRSEALQSALLDAVSHDLRTPLATIRAAAGTILEGDRVPEAERIASAATIDQEADHLSQMVSNLLEVGRVEGGALRIDRTSLDLEEEVGAVLDRYRKLLDGREIKVAAAPEPILVAADPVLLERIVANLLDNAAQFVAPGQRIRIGITQTETMATLSLDDSGPGVPPEALPHLFDKFYRAKPLEGHRPGTGLGLAVVRGLTEAMGGRVAARTSPLGGLGIDVDLPRAAIPDDLEEHVDS